MDAPPKDIETAKRFLDCCYNDALRMPARPCMQRLVTLGWVEEVAPGTYAETAALRAAVIQ